MSHRMCNMCTMMDFCSSFVSVHVYFSVPLNLITRCDCDTFGMNRNNSRFTLWILKRTFSRLFLFSLSASREHVPAWMQVCVLMLSFVCVSAVWQDMFDGGRRKGWSDSSDTGRWAGSQVEVLIILQKGPFKLGLTGRDLRDGVRRRSEAEDITLSYT